MNYVIYELQEDRDGNVSFVPPVVKTNEDDAWAEYYLKLAYAIKSDVYIHTVELRTTDGRQIDSKCYMHGVNGGAE